jgi:hypothetical protein
MFFGTALSAVRAIRAMTSCYQPTTRAQRYTAIRQTSGLRIVNPTAMLETTGPVNCLSVELGTRSKRNFHSPESNCGVAINCACEAFIVDRLALSLCYLFQALEDGHFTKREISPTILGRGTQGDRSATCGIFFLLGDDFSPFRSATGRTRRGEFGLHVV